MTHMDELMTLGSTYIWRCSKGIYRFAPEIYQALISQPLTGDLPMECLHHLPEWAVYVETPGLSYERHPMIEKNRNTAHKIICSRNDLIVLLTEIHLKTGTPQELSEKYKVILEKLNEAYASAPDTTQEAVDEATAALKDREEFSYSDQEIDKFLPLHLQRGDRKA